MVCLAVWAPCTKGYCVNFNQRVILLTRDLKKAANGARIELLHS